MPVGHRFLTGRRSLSGICTRIYDRHRAVVDLDQLDGGVRNLMDISGNHVKRIGQQDQRLAVGTVLERIDLGHGHRISGVAAQPPDGVSGVKYQPALFEDADRLGKNLVYCLFHNYIHHSPAGISSLVNIG